MIAVNNAFSVKNWRLVTILTVWLAMFPLTTSHDRHKHGNHDDNNTIVDTSLGRLRGSTMRTWTNKRIFSFRGVPFAEPPVGKLRFKAPVSIKPWSGIKDAIEDAKVCPQPYQEEIGPSDEDCLYLNVYSKNLNGSIPVIVFFHPGAFYSLTGASYWFGPQYLLDQDVVLVTVNYRLDALGFLCTGDKFAVGNYGMKDQVEALRWVQKHIKGFGGNPNKVTIAGYSVGSTSTFLHMVSPMSRGLFHNVIAMSCGVTSNWVINNDPLTLSKKFAKLFNCTTDSNEKMIECLRKVPALNINKNFNELRVFEGLPMILFSPVIEPDLGTGEERFLTEHPITTIKNKKVYQVPVVAGITEYEFLSWSKAVIDDDSSRKQLMDNFDSLAPVIFGYSDKNSSEAKELTNKFKQFYFDNKPITTSKESIYKLGQAFSDYLVIYGEYTTAKLLTKYSEKPVYFYILSYNGNDSHLKDPATNKTLGPVHHDDLLYLFYVAKRNNPILSENDGDAFMVKYETTFWKNFASNGNPTPDNSPIQWTPLSKNSNFQYFNFDKQLKMEDWSQSSFSERMKFWESLFPVDK